MRIRVADTGIGIPAAYLPHLFDEFSQASQGISRSYEGIGLGMALTKRLTALLDGTLEVESEENRGTTVEVVLPRGRASA